mmetsp:Transcript_93579/g.279301  ORF Transcript_93579/g.279301 Transcript_93579/m.279301 type:complete len:146 (-) Transcript_93579:65-502(-)
MDAMPASTDPMFPDALQAIDKMNVMTADQMDAMPESMLPDALHARWMDEPPPGLGSETAPPETSSCESRIRGLACSAQGAVLRVAYIICSRSKMSRCHVASVCNRLRSEGFMLSRQFVHDTLQWACTAGVFSQVPVATHLYFQLS